MSHPPRFIEDSATQSVTFRTVGGLHLLRPSLAINVGRSSLDPAGRRRRRAGGLAYLLAHGAKEGLVASPLDWPGITSARALVGAEELVGYWVDGREACEARRRKRPTDPSEYTIAYPIELAPLPAWARESRAELQRRCRDLVRAAEDDVRRDGGAVVGVQAVLDSSPFERSAEPERHAPTRFHWIVPSRWRGASSAIPRG